MCVLFNYYSHRARDKYISSSMTIVVISKIFLRISSQNCVTIQTISKPRASITSALTVTIKYVIY